MKYFLHLLMFGAINFGALFVGSMFTTPAVEGTWYSSLDKAPWTPPGYVFGLAWFSIMVCFSFFMANVWNNKQLTPRYIVLYTTQVVLNISWNIVFFYMHATWAALIVIVALLLIVLVFTRNGFKTSTLQGVLMSPYALWLCIAVSLNAYVCFAN